MKNLSELSTLKLTELHREIRKKIYGLDVSSAEYRKMVQHFFDITIELRGRLSSIKSFKRKLFIDGGLVGNYKKELSTPFLSQVKTFFKNLYA